MLHVLGVGVSLFVGYIILKSIDGFLSSFHIALSYFPVLIIAWCIAGALGYLVYKLLSEASCVVSDFSLSDAKTFGVIFAGGFCAMFAAMSLNGLILRTRLENNCQTPFQHVRSCHYNGELRVRMDFPVWFELLPFNLLATILVPSVLAWLTVAYSREFVAGYVSLTTSHPANHSITRATSHNQPTTVTRELARIMEAQEIDDRRAHALINQMSPYQQFIAKTKYAKRLQEAERLRTMVEKRVSAIQAETKLAHETLEMERRKRGRER